jgi:ABC-type lipoprotein release transport system permease subunit
MMPAALQTLLVIVQMALRNLFANRWKTLIVGGIIAFGALLVVIGTSLLDAVDDSMRRSITGSIAGDIQVYSADSKDDVQVMGSATGEAADLVPIDDFAKLRSVLERTPNVANIVPMGINTGLVSFGNSVDQALDALRRTTVALQRDDASAETKQRYEAQKAHVRQMLSVFQRELGNTKLVSARNLSDEIAFLREATSTEFWAGFDRDAFANLESLENRVAALAPDSELLLLRYVGTDPAAFRRAFDRMEITDGEAIPAGKRGFMFSKYVYEDLIKLKAARGLDKLKTGIDERHATIADDADLKRIVHENTLGGRELLFQLDAIQTERVRAKLQKLLHSRQSDVAQLLAQFFATDDANFHERYRFFYAEIAPEIQLYKVAIGDTLAIKVFTRSGYVQSANLKVYGTYSFQGLEKSAQAGLTNMMDLVSFRQLYGFMTPDRQREVETLRTTARVRDVSRQDAETVLFGAKEDAEAVEATGGSGLAELLANLPGTRRRQEQHAQTSYDPKQLEEGVVLNVAVTVKDASKIPETARAIEKGGEAAGLRLRADPWQKAAGLLGQFATLMRAVLYVAVLIIFVVALVVINNALVMATLERVRDIGTLRAVGAQRRFILTVLVLESIVMGLMSGGLGALLGAIILLVLKRIGIPAANDVMTFFFSGQRLFPDVGPRDVAFALGTVLVVSVVSGVYPAWLAMRVSPREAMQAED